jgi:hypothetical protein
MHGVLCVPQRVCCAVLQAASMVPEYLTPTNGGMLSPGQLMALVRVVFGRQADSQAAVVCQGSCVEVLISVIKHSTHCTML